jgi:hypothetical protein
VCQAALPDCRFEGGELRGHAASDGMLWTVATRGRKRGLALNTADPEQSGDLLDLVTHALCGGDRSAGYRWALQFRGAAASRPAPQPSHRDAKPADESDATKRARYWSWYERALPGRGSPVEAYLGARGLTPDIVDLPDVLRFSPRCRYVHDEQTARWTHRPAMLAPIVNPISGAFLALHATYLEQIDGVWRKVASKPARKCWGSYAGGVIALANGRSGKPLREAPAGDACLIAEGIENALSASFVRPELRVLAGVSVSNFPTIALPPAIGLVCLVCDDDGEKTHLDEIRERAIDRWRREGRSREQMTPLRGCEDLNDWLQRELAL